MADLRKKISVRGAMAHIPLTHGYEAMIDAADLPLVDWASWCAKVDPHSVYARASVNGRTAYMHRLILGAKPGSIIDHIDGNGLNNTRANLREATPSQNMHNRKKGKNNSSGYKGVSLERSTGKWRARIKINHLEKYVGVYRCPTAAAIAYARASAELHREFGRTE